MAAEWRNFKAKMKAKRIDKGKGKKKDTVSAFNDENDTLVVQRLSAEVMVAHSYHSKFAKDFAKKPSKINRYFNENVKQKISNT